MHPGSARERCTCSTLSLRTWSNESCRAVTLPVTMIISCPRVFGRLFQLIAVLVDSVLVDSWSRRGVGCIGRFGRLLRPALQRGAAGVGEHVDPALGAIEPAIDIVQQDFRRVGNLWFQIAYPPRPPHQRKGTGERLLTVSR